MNNTELKALIREIYNEEITKTPIADDVDTALPPTTANEDVLLEKDPPAAEEAPRSKRIPKRRALERIKEFVRYDETTGKLYKRSKSQLP